MIQPFNTAEVSGKSFSEMTQAEFSYLKRLHNEGKLNAPEPKFKRELETVKTFTDNYIDKETPRNQQNDFDRWVGSRNVSNRMLMKKVRAQKKLEAIQQKQSQGTGIMTEDQFYKNKLFTNKCFL